MDLSMDDIFSTPKKENNDAPKKGDNGEPGKGWRKVVAVSNVIILVGVACLIYFKINRT